MAFVQPSKHHPQHVGNHYNGLWCCAILFAIGFLFYHENSLPRSRTLRGEPANEPQKDWEDEMAQSIADKVSSTLQMQLEELGKGNAANPAESERVVAVGNDNLHAAESNLPAWVTGWPTHFQLEMDKGSTGLTDKVNRGHRFQYAYQPSLSRLVKRKLHPKTVNRKIRMLEIGLGCSPEGGIIRNTPGGSALGWNHLFRQVEGIEFELHIIEFDEACGRHWAESHKELATVHIGDQSSREDLVRIVKDSGGAPFDVIVDDGSHMNDHQIFSFDNLLEFLAPNGLYFIEDIGSSCKNWPANFGSHRGQGVGGTVSCMTTGDGKPTILSHLMEYQRRLVGGPPYQQMLRKNPDTAAQAQPLHGVTNIQIFWYIFVISKEVELVV